MVGFNSGNDMIEKVTGTKNILPENAHLNIMIKWHLWENMGWGKHKENKKDGGALKRLNVTNNKEQDSLEKRLKSHLLLC